MPVMDGFTALSEIRADPSTAALPVLAISASTFHQDENYVKSKGFDGFIRKPVIIHELLSQLCRFLKYTSTPEIEPSINPVKTSAGSLTSQEFKELVDKLVSEVEPLVATALKKQSIQIARQLLSLAVPVALEYNWDPFTDWVKSLQTAVDSFDITLLGKELREFGNLLANARGVADNKHGKPN